MADEQSPHDSELTPEQESTLRRLLADARHDDGIPEAVADRLDRVLAQLHDEPAGADAPVVELAARRRRRNAGRLLLAAAAIVLGGATVGQYVGTSGDDAGVAGDAAGSSAEAPNARTTGPGAEAFAEAESDGSPSDAQEAAPEATAPGALDQADALTDGEPVRLSPETFDQDVRSFALARRDQLSQLAAAADKYRALLNRAKGFDCPRAAYGKGTLVAVYYDEQPAVLAFRPPLGSNRVAELLRCGTGETLRSVTLADANQP